MEKRHGAFIVKKEGVDLKGEDVQDSCRGQISRYKVPKHIAFVDSYPMTASGKIQKHKLQEMSVDLFPGEDRQRLGDTIDAIVGTGNPALRPITLNWPVDMASVFLPAVTRCISRAKSTGRAVLVSVCQKWFQTKIPSRILSDICVTAMPIKHFGALETPWLFLRNQFAMQLLKKKHLRHLQPM